MIEHVAVLPWSTGAVGMIGMSHYCWSQWKAARTRPPHLQGPKKLLITHPSSFAEAQMYYFDEQFHRDRPHLSTLRLHERPRT
jgi:predicted acyl esterase